jgi:MYXO-CTERM domain-containing protein
MLLASAAPAAFTGVNIYQFDSFFDVSHPSANVQAAWDANPGLDVYRVYAEFDAPGRVISTFGASNVGQEMYLSNLQNGTFFNYIETSTYPSPSSTHFNTAPASSQFSNVATAVEAFDTYATIGAIVNDSNTTLSPGLAAGTNNFQTNWSSDGGDGGTGGWFSFDPLAAQTNALEGDASQGMADDGVWRVLLYQVTVKEGAKVEGQFGVTTDTGNEYGTHTFFSTNPVPAPGALALLGLAGLAGARRRRK